MASFFVWHWSWLFRIKAAQLTGCKVCNKIARPAFWEGFYLASQQSCFQWYLDAFKCVNDRVKHLVEWEGCLCKAIVRKMCFMQNKLTGIEGSWLAVNDMFFVVTACWMPKCCVRIHFSGSFWHGSCPRLQCAHMKSYLKQSLCVTHITNYTYQDRKEAFSCLSLVQTRMFMNQTNTPCMDVCGTISQVKWCTRCFVRYLLRHKLNIHIHLSWLFLFSFLSLGMAKTVAKAAFRERLVHELSAIS